MDGWGHGKKDENNAIYQANTPFVDGLYQSVPNAELRTDGENVGLPEGQMGNSEVGHLNIGAGRIVYQDLVKINHACADGSLAANQVLEAAIQFAKENDKPIHLMGLVSRGGVHSSQEHLHALIDILEMHSCENVFIHAFTDGRDTDPEAGKKYISNLMAHLDGKHARLASLVGRYYAMDRDKRWERIKKAYDLLVNGQGQPSTDILASIQSSYDQGIGDEFITPIVMQHNKAPVATFNEGDVVICFNFRTDRCRQITHVLTQEHMHEYNMHRMDLHYVTMTRYDETFRNVQVLFDKDNLEDTMGEHLSRSGKTQLRIAETEKYPHVTFFFSGGREAPFEGESRIMVDSPKVATYDLQPEMSAREVTEKAIAHLKKHRPDFMCLNYANPDMVGHTGVFDAIVHAVQTTDRCAEELVNAGKALGYEFIIIADHGNADIARNEDGTPHTAHTTNPVPVFYIGNSFKHIRNGILADVSPSLLSLMKIPQPLLMTGVSLLE